MCKSIDIHDIPQVGNNLLAIGRSKCIQINEEMFMHIPTNDFDAQSQLNREQDHASKKTI